MDLDCQDWLADWGSLHQSQWVQINTHTWTFMCRWLVRMWAPGMVAGRVLNRKNKWKSGQSIWLRSFILKLTCYMSHVRLKVTVKSHAQNVVSLWQQSGDLCYTSFFDLTTFSSVFHELWTIFLNDLNADNKLESSQPFSAVIFFPIYTEMLMFPLHLLFYFFHLQTSTTTLMVMRGKVQRMASHRMALRRCPT